MNTIQQQNEEPVKEYSMRHPLDRLPLPLPRHFVSLPPTGAASERPHTAEHSHPPEDVV